MNIIRELCGKIVNLCGGTCFKRSETKYPPPSTHISKSYSTRINNSELERTNVVTDIYGRKIIKYKSFVYLGYPFIDTDEESY